MKVSATISQQNEFSGPDLDSREDFPELKPSRNNQTVQSRTLIRRQEMEKTKRQSMSTDMTIKKELHINNPNQNRNVTENPIQHNENNVFKY